MYLVYLFISAIQIRSGYYDIKRKSLFKRNTPFTNNISKGFNAIPFLPEIRNTVDWTFTSTCFDLFQWNKFESIYNTIFDTYADAGDDDDKKIGEKIEKKQKITWGGTLSFVLILLLVIPLILFSSLNPTNILNNVSGGKLTVDLIFNYKDGVILNFNLFENQRAKTINNIFTGGDENWVKYNYSDSVQTRNFNHEQVQIITFSETSDRNWDLAEPHINELIEILDINKNKKIESIELQIKAQFERPLPAEFQKVEQSFEIKIWSDSMGVGSEGAKKIEELRTSLSECKNLKIDFSDVYAPPLRLTAGEGISEVEDEKYFFKKDVQLGFQGCQIENKTINGEVKPVKTYLKSYFTFKSKDSSEVDSNTTNVWKGVEFHAFNDKISKTTSGYSVVGFYLTFILVAGTYVKEFLASEPEKIMFSDLPHPETIIDLCEGIQISRYNYDFQNEEYLYTILIELMRSPEYLKSMTQSSIENFEIRQRKAIQNNEYEVKEFQVEGLDDYESDKENEKAENEEDKQKAEGGPKNFLEMLQSLKK